MEAFFLPHWGRWGKPNQPGFVTLNQQVPEERFILIINTVHVNRELKAKAANIFHLMPGPSP